MPDPYEKIEQPDYDPGDLFRKAQTGEGSNAYVDINRGAYAMWLYSRGYFRAAERLGQRLIVNDGDVDLEIYPLVYMYRHAVELVTKYIHRILEEVLRTGSRFEPTHKIMDNWTAMQNDLKLALQEDESAPRPDLGKIEQILTDLVTADPIAEAFRFPQTRAGAEPAADLRSINLNTFGLSLKYVEAELEQIVDWLHDLYPSPIL